MAKPRTTMMIFIILAAIVGAMVWMFWTPGEIFSQSSAMHAAGKSLKQNSAPAVALPLQKPAESKQEIPWIEFPKSKWESANIVLHKVTRSSFATSIPLTGKISLNMDRVAHVYSMVDGSVESVAVSLGERVPAEALLAVIHSRDIGDAKLKLYQANLKLELAISRRKMQEEAAANATQLIAALREKSPIEKIEVLFRSRPMGDYRERLLSAYASYLKSAADVARLQDVVERGAVAGSQLLSAEANRNADQATFQARLEQIAYEISLSELTSSQSVREAESEVAVASTSLMILGCEPEELAANDPSMLGEAISHYNIRAPFDGVVLTKDVVLREHVKTDNMLFSIADLSSVWITADVYAEHVPLLSNLQGRTIAFHCDSWPGQSFEAEIFYTGDVMDESTRTIAMRAKAHNTDRRLKPGMFVNISLPGLAETDVLQVPASAIQESASETFVFVHHGDGKFEPRTVKLGGLNAQNAMVLDGLQADESIVVQGGFILKSMLLAESMGE